MHDPLAGLGSFGLPVPSDLVAGDTSASWRRPRNIVLIDPPDDAVTPLELGSLSFRALNCPGHTPGSTVLEISSGENNPVLLTGDVLFAQGVGRTDLPGGDPQAMPVSLRRLVQLFDASLPVLPGHGPGSVLGREMVTNPYLIDALEV
jgi:glyoxylase-like metal-dependent hydrolase (beta-lactamase superfamily II)